MEKSKAFQAGFKVALNAIQAGGLLSVAAEKNPYKKQADAAMFAKHLEWRTGFFSAQRAA